MYHSVGSLLLLRWFMTIKQLTTGTAEYEDMIALRLKVLLNPIGIPRSYIDPQKEAADVLIGAFNEAGLVGCCILTRVDETTLQLRQMAVNNEAQGTGIGRAIVRFAEGIAREKGYRVLMMHARDGVLDFYKKCGYTISGQSFFEVGIGHHKMEKQVTQP